MRYGTAVSPEEYKAERKAEQETWKGRWVTYHVVGVRLDQTVAEAGRNLSFAAGVEPPAPPCRVQFRSEQEEHKPTVRVTVEFDSPLAAVLGSYHEFTFHEQSDFKDGLTKFVRAGLHAADLPSNLTHKVLHLLVPRDFEKGDQDAEC